MDITSLITTAASAYPDELLLACWDDEKNQPKDNPDAGDMLELFIVREIADTYDAKLPDAEQVEAVINALSRASNEIDRVASVVQNLTLPAIRQKQALITKRKEPHAGRRN